MYHQLSGGVMYAKELSHSPTYRTFTFFSHIYKKLTLTIVNHKIQKMLPHIFFSGGKVPNLSLLSIYAVDSMWGDSDGEKNRSYIHRTNVTLDEAESCS